MRSAGCANLLGVLVTEPQARLEVAPELVLDHEPRGRERQQPVEHGARERRAERAVDAAFHRREPDRVADVREHDVRKRPDEQRIARFR